MNGNSTVAELPQALSLRQNFAWTLAGNILYAACQWGMLVAIVKLGTPAMVGQFSLGLAIAAPVYMLTNMHLRAVQATDARHEYRFGHYLALRLLGTTLALLAILAVATILASYRPETALVVFGVALAKAAESISDVLYGLWQNRERLDKISIAMIGRGITSLAALATVLHFTRGIVAAVFALALVWCTWLLTYERGLARTMLKAESGDYLLPAWQAERLMTLAGLSLPLGFVTLLLSLSANIPRYLVEHFEGEAKLGYFSALAYLLVAPSTIMNALGQSASPRFARYYLSDRDAFARLLFKMLCVATALGVTGLLMTLIGGKAILSLLYKPEYAQYAGIFTWLMMAGCIDLLSASVGFAFTSTRRFREYTIPFACNTSLGAIIGFFLIPRMGLRGAAFTAILISSGQLLSLTLLLRNALKKNPVPHGQASTKIL